MSASTEQARREQLRQDAAGVALHALPDRYPAMLDPVEAAEIARGLITKYGAEALAYGQDRASRAIEIGDELALTAWRAVIAETRHLLSQVAEV